MLIEPYDFDSRHRKLLPYNPAYSIIFGELARFVETNLADTRLIHIGSSAVPGLASKPMIDVLAVTNNPDLRSAQNELLKLGFQRREIWVDTDEKPYLCGAVTHDGETYNVNVHICHADDETCRKLQAFRDILRNNRELRMRYEQAKKKALENTVNQDPRQYNRAKEPVILEILKMCENK